MRTHGRPYAFRQRPWDEIDAFLGDMADRHVDFRHMSDIVKSVLASDQTGALAACTSMHDLVVVPMPIPKPPYGVVAVRAPGSIRQPAMGFVRMSTSLRRVTTMSSTGLWLMRFRCFGDS
jgi:hypothetical protein